jgi:hypothetical protein
MCVVHKILRRCSNERASERCDFLVDSRSNAIAMEVTRVDVTMKLNVLAICAAFVFVSAIVLGAF